jgi:hypothetical protein
MDEKRVPDLIFEKLSVIFQMAKVAVPRALFCEILYRIRHLTLMAIPSEAG